ncbi:MAG TPA: GDSL-type esterase/lipase family protein [bacterium]|nr:GDSL-type esterase/lipase family protein [bacterium]HPN42302.1 GDSL-type esterase/lipase family protein [bacterium]
MKRTLFLLVLLLVSCLYAEPGDTLKVAVIGNSITIGAGINNPATDSYPGQLGAFLGPLYDVHNFGVSGRTMLRHGDYPIWNEQFFKDALALDADIVIILLGTNDTKPYNWIYKDEYLDDYRAMIDTFSQGDKEPQFFLSYPPPAFCVNFDIRDSVITADIIPMVDTMLAETGAHKVDFYTPLLSRADLFPDCIHPNVDGHTLMAQILYKEFTGNELRQVQDVNVALNKVVTMGGPSGTGNVVGYFGLELNDGNYNTLWGDNGLPLWAIIDLGQPTEIDMFQSFFDVGGKGYQYTIEVSSDSSVWTTVVDQTARTDTSKFGIDKIAPVQAEYVRFTFTGAAASDDQFYLREFKILQANGGLHAPILDWAEFKKYKTNVQVDVNFIRTTNEGECIKLYKKYQTDEQYNPISGYRGGAYTSHRTSVKFDAPCLFYVASFKDGMEIISDTLVVDYSQTAVEQQAGQSQPVAFQLGQNYPNPFNPSTTIEFYLPERSRAAIQIFDLQGRLVRELGAMEYTAGAHQVTWDTLDNSGNKVASGVYLYRLKANNLTLDKKLVLVR